MQQPVRRHGTPFAAHDVHRVSEFFDGELEATYAFMQATWLPDAFASVSALAECLRNGDTSASVFMCDHLRQGALAVGARGVAVEAESIAATVFEGRWLVAGARVRMLFVQLSIAQRWLKRRLYQFSDAADAYRAVEHPEEETKAAEFSTTFIAEA